MRASAECQRIRCGRAAGGERDETGTQQPGIAGMMVEALWEAGLLNEIVATKEGLVVWLEEWAEMSEFEP